MNLIVRFWWMVLSIRRRPRIRLGDVARLQLRVWPNDLDSNIHMTNSRYLSFMDLGRVDQLVRTGLWRTCKEKGWLPMAAGIQIRYRRELRPLARFTLETRFKCWDDKWWIIEQLFLVNGEIAAVALVKTLFLRKGAKGHVPAAEILRGMGEEGLDRPMTDSVRNWLQSEIAATEEAKKVFAV